MPIAAPAPSGEESAQSETARNLDRYLDEIATHHVTKPPVPQRNPQDTLRELDQTLFKKGACHALALELLQEFKAAGRKAELWYLPNREAEDVAEHVMVKTSDGFFDADFGPQTEDAVVAVWTPKGTGRPMPVSSLDDVQSPQPVPSSQIHSRLGLRLDPDFLPEARRRARFFIAANRSSFGLP